MKAKTSGVFAFARVGAFFDFQFRIGFIILNFYAVFFILNRSKGLFLRFL